VKMTKYVGAMDDDVMELAENYSRYVEQGGGLIPNVFIEDGQYGEGWAEVMDGLRKFYNPVAPIVAAGARALKRHALGGLTGFVGDLVSGRNWKEAARARATETGRNIRENLTRMAGQGGGRGSNKTMRLACKVLSRSEGRVTKRRRRKKRKSVRKIAKRRTPKRRKRTAAKRKTVARRRKRTQKGGDIDGWL
jgi:hypothetical protein